MKTNEKILEKIEATFDFDVTTDTWNANYLLVVAKSNPDDLIKLFQTPSALIPSGEINNLPGIFVCEGFLYVQESAFKERLGNWAGVSEDLFKGNSRAVKAIYNSLKKAGGSYGVLIDIYDKLSSYPEISLEAFEKGISSVENQKHKLYMQSVKPAAFEFDRWREFISSSVKSMFDGGVENPAQFSLPKQDDGPFVIKNKHLSVAESITVSLNELSKKESVGDHILNLSNDLDRYIACNLLSRKIDNIMQDVPKTREPEKENKESDLKDKSVAVMRESHISVQDRKVQIISNIVHGIPEKFRGIAVDVLSGYELIDSHLRVVNDKGMEMIELEERVKASIEVQGAEDKEEVLRAVLKAGRGKFDEFIKDLICELKNENHKLLCVTVLNINDEFPEYLSLIEDMIGEKSYGKIQKDIDERKVILIENGTSKSDANEKYLDLENILKRKHKRENVISFPGKPKKRKRMSV